jgi:hypothetical protein
MTWFEWLAVLCVVALVGASFVQERRERWKRELELVRLHELWFPEHEEQERQGAIVVGTPLPPPLPPDRLAVLLVSSPDRVPTHCQAGDVVLAREPVDQRPFRDPSPFQLLPFLGSLPTDGGLWMWDVRDGWRRMTPAEVACVARGADPLSSQEAS